jgi:hypothetical protein
MTDFSKIKHWSPKDFNKFDRFLSQELLNKLDIFAEKFSKYGKLRVSPVDGAIIRIDDSDSQHNIKKTGKTFAIDLIPMFYTNVSNHLLRGIQRKEFKMLFELMKNSGFAGIGMYPEWIPFRGVHVDVRKTAPKYWVMINGEYVYIPELAWEGK